MMLSILIESALRSLFPGIAAWTLLKLLRVRNPSVERIVWITVLLASIAMPLLMQWAIVPAQAPTIAWVVSAEPVVAVSAAVTDWQAAAFYCYLGIAAVFLVRQFSGVMRSRRICRRSIRADGRADGSWMNTLDVRTSDEIRAPATFASTVLLPASHVDWSATKRLAVLAHERTHVMNGDFHVQFLAHLYRAFFWFNPLAWWLPRRLALIGEQLSDDAAIDSIGDRAGYAQILLEFSRSSRELPGALAMARLATVASRIERILESGVVPGRAGRMLQFAWAGALLPIVWFAAGCSADQEGPAQSGGPQPPATQSPVTPAPIDQILPKSNQQFPLAHPMYPAESRRARQHGTVVLRLHVLEDGSIDDVQIKKSSGFARLDYSAANTALDWRVDPGTAGGKPVPMWGEFAVTFKLSD